MAERGRNWTDDEIRALLAIWAEDRIQRQLLGTVRNAAVFRTISDKLQQRGHSRDTKQCREKIKALKKKYKEVADRLRRSGVGIESDDDLEDHEIFIGFKWFEDLHPVMRRRAVVSPPALLDSSALSSPDVQDQLEPEGEQQAEDVEGQLSDAAVVRPTEGTQPQLDSDQPGPSGSSVHVATAMGASDRVDAAPGPSNREDTAPGPSNREDATPRPSNREDTAPGPSNRGDAEPMKKKRKTTKVEKMENTMKQLYEKFSAQQEKARKEAREMEARRIELEERQAKREEERDTQFLMLMREMCSTRHNTLLPPPAAPLPGAYGYPPMYTFQPPDEEDQQ